MRADQPESTEKVAVHISLRVAIIAVAVVEAMAMVPLIFHLASK